MKKLTLFIVIVAISHSYVAAQGCLPSGITISTQQQIDNFHVNYPGCSIILGSATISGADIVNLTGLNVLTTVKGTLSVSYNPVLTSLTGLGMLDTVGNSLIIGNNASLDGLSGLQSLGYVGYDFKIGNNPALTSIVTGGKLKKVYAELQIISNQSLSSLSGFDGLESAGLLTIRGNNLLASLAGLDNINGFSMAGLTIMDNPNLATCDVKSVCDYIESHPGEANILNNAPGCNNQAEVEEACGIFGVEEIPPNSGFSIYPNPSTSQITIETSATQIPGLLSILNPGGQQLMQHRLTESKMVIDISQLPGGVYVVRITNDRMVETTRLIKQ